jgi:hypothetical protein
LSKNRKRQPTTSIATNHDEQESQNDSWHTGWFSRPQAEN